MQNNKILTCTKLNIRHLLSLLCVLHHLVSLQLSYFLEDNQRRQFQETRHPSHDQNTVVRSYLLPKKRSDAIDLLLQVCCYIITYLYCILTHENNRVFDSFIPHSSTILFQQGEPAGATAGGIVGVSRAYVAGGLAVLAGSLAGGSRGRRFRGRAHNILDQR